MSILSSLISPQQWLLAITSPEAWLAALTIFALRVTDMSLDTLRMLFVVRGRKRIAWALGFGQAAVFVIAITSVLTGLEKNPLMVLFYAAGFATGNVVGMLVEERLAVGHMRLNIISKEHGSEVATLLRSNGYAVTEIPAKGLTGRVNLLSVSVLRKDVDHVDQLVHQLDESAFITSEHVQPIRSGFWRA